MGSGEAGQSAARTRGCLLGGAVGDALGAPVEFMRLDAIRHGFGPKGIREYATAYGREGAVTDDTQMTLFTAEGLLRAWRGAGGGFAGAPDSVHHAYLRWLWTQGVAPNAAIGRERPWPDPWPDGWLVQQPELRSCRAPGNTCISALEATVRLGDAAANDSKGCGTVMRVAPVGLVARALPGDGYAAAFDLGLEVSRLTHGHPSGYLAGGYFALLIALVSDGLPLRDANARATQPLRGRAEAVEVLRAIEGALRLAGAGEPTPERIESLGGAWVAEEAVAIAVYVALVAHDFESAIRLAVNHGGDSDSTGSLAGNLLGAMWGEDAIPGRWLDGLELRPVIAQVADDLAALRDGAFGAAERARYPED
jgi:ADP-ribosylglycohydrolase